MARAKRLAIVATVLALAATGCGGSEGIEKGATVTVYAAAAACQGAKRALDNEGGSASSLRIRVSCLPSVEEHGHFDLATIGANARQATEDSSTIAYIGEIEPAATRFSETILEEAGIAQLPHMPGAVAMRKVLHAIEEAGDSAALREDVRDQVDEGQ